MVNEKKIKLMTKLALYDAHEGKRDEMLCKYYRKDYVSFHVIISLLWVTLGYILGVVLWGLASYEEIMDNLNQKFLFATGISVIIGYVAIVFTFGVISYGIYDRRHNNAIKRMKKYKRDMMRLKKI